MSRTLLLLCPFCGGHAERTTGGEDESKRFGTRCSDFKCPGGTHGLFHKSQEDADAAWNTRTGRADVPEIYYGSLIDAAKLSNKTWTPGKTGCIAFSKGAVWFRNELLRNRDVQPEQESNSAIRTLQKLGYTWRGGELWAPPLGSIPKRFSVRPDYPDAFNDMGNAIERALNVCAVTDVLSLITGTFVGLTVELCRREGHDADKEIKIDGGKNRHITIHGKNG
jgi:hypothetical protein